MTHIQEVGERNTCPEWGFILLDLQISSLLETLISRSVWWLILCVNREGPWGTQTFGQIFFWVCLWGCFWMRLTFESVDWLKQIALLNFCGVSSNQRKTRLEQKGWVRGNFSCLTHQLEYWSLLAFELRFKHWHFLGLQLASFWTRMPIIGSPASQTFRLELELYHWLSWIFSLLTADLEDLSASIIMWANSL